MRGYSRSLNSSEVRPACSMIDARVLRFKSLVVVRNRYAQVRFPQMLENMMTS
jgi:hypothetical protein